MIVALLGFGTVGKGVYDLIIQDHPSIKIKYVLDRHPEKTQGIKALVVDDYDIILNDPQVDTIIELLGGSKNAYPYVKKAIMHSKNVVTANKALISEHFRELHELTQSYHTHLRYEASVGAGIIVIDPLMKSSPSDPVTEITGIINGSTNFILTEVFDHESSLDQALENARKLGYIETGTNDDLMGLDLMRKINILSMIAYQQVIDEKAINLIPLQDIGDALIREVKDLHLVIKYVATSTFENECISIHLEPVVFNRNHVFSKVSGTDNIILVKHLSGKTDTYFGPGAGRYETAGAVIHDLLRIDEKISLKMDQHHLVKLNDQPSRYLIKKGNQVTLTRPITLTSVLKIKDTQGILRVDEAVKDEELSIFESD